nr:hypothetical protein BaRGS_013743 [Batillaria attramentaria]
MVGPSKRTFAAIFIEVMWCAGELVLVVMAYFIRDWRLLEIALSVPAAVMLVYWWLIPESPRWLASRGKTAEAMAVLEKVAASNNTHLPKVDETTKLVGEEKTLGFRHVFRSRELVARMLIYFFDLWVITVVYYGLTLNITNLSGDLFINFALNIVLETVGYMTPIFLAGRLGRKPVLCSSMIIAGVACTASVLPVILHAPGWIVVALSMIGRFFDCVAFAVIYLFAAELFPTVVRSSTIGVGVTLSRVGNFVAPYLADVGVLMGGRFRDALPLVVMGTPAIV